MYNTPEAGIFLFEDGEQERVFETHRNLWGYSSAYFSEDEIVGISADKKVTLLTPKTGLGIKSLRNGDYERIDLDTESQVSTIQKLGNSTYLVQCETELYRLENGKLTQIEYNSSARGSWNTMDNSVLIRDDLLLGFFPMGEFQGSALELFRLSKNKVESIYYEEKDIRW